MRGGMVDAKFVVPLVDGRFRDFGDERCHREFDVELHHVGDRVELDVNYFVVEEHKKDEYQLM